MASATGSSHGGRRQNSGRKRKFVDGKEAKKEWHRCHKRIYLEKDTLQSWLQVKFIAGFEARSDSAFAAYLLSQEVRRTSSTEVSSALPSSNFQRRRKASNPRKHVMKQSEESEGTQTSMPEKCTDQAAVVEPTISSPDISLHIQSESSPESTSLNESSNPNTPYSTS